jgi:NAD(P)-dependent dehydrogenase (short-subunit alcohol dehydrogenase family)
MIGDLPVPQGKSSPTMAPQRTALVTAASAGLGAAIARMLVVDLGMSVVINYSQNADRAEKLVRVLSEAGSSRWPAAPPTIHAVQADLTKRSEVIRLVEEATAVLGGNLDVVVSNVGWTRMRNFSDLDDGLEEEDWDRCFTVNVKSHLWLFHATRKFLDESNAREEGGAVFVSTASVAGVKPGGSSLVSVVLFRPLTLRTHWFLFCLLLLYH